MSDLHVRDAEPDEFAEVVALSIAGFDGPRRPNAERLALLSDAAGRARDGRTGPACATSRPEPTNMNTGWRWIRSPGSCSAPSPPPDPAGVSASSP